MSTTQIITLVIAIWGALLATGKFVSDRQNSVRQRREEDRKRTTALDVDVPIEESDFYEWVKRIAHEPTWRAVDAAETEHREQVLLENAARARRWTPDHRKYLERSSASRPAQRLLWPVAIVNRSEHDVAVRRIYVEQGPDEETRLGYQSSVTSDAEFPLVLNPRRRTDVRIDFGSLINAMAFHIVVETEDGQTFRSTGLEPSYLGPRNESTS